MKNIIIIIFTCFIFVTPSVAYEEGSQILRYCMTDGIEDPIGGMQKEERKSFFWCLGFTSAVYDMGSWKTDYDCDIPKGTIKLEIMMQVRKYITNYPDQIHLPAVYIVVKAIRHKWCVQIKQTIKSPKKFEG